MDSIKGKSTRSFRCSLRAFREEDHEVMARDFYEHVHNPSQRGRANVALDSIEVAAEDLLDGPGDDRRQEVIFLSRLLEALLGMCGPFDLAFVLALVLKDFDGERPYTRPLKPAGYVDGPRLELTARLREAAIGFDLAEGLEDGYPRISPETTSGYEMVVRSASWRRKVNKGTHATVAPRKGEVS